MDTMKKILTIITLLTISLFGEDYKHQIYLTSIHSIKPFEDNNIKNNKYNNMNLGYSYRFDNNLKIGAYNNSVNKTTVFLGYEGQFNDNFGYVIAVGTGYESPIGGGLYGRYKNFRVDLLPAISVDNNNNYRYGVALGAILVF
jgi:hypothetical protein